ncbi:hypothetical protein B0F90DRAFT_960156 [Multifurca ochricompacta]|uniref:Uncharacterized protein n=1 Tax=Multifurca ochricompacta TaxID=376703 RepID=A0AAD4MBI9_9AGAM|nr:hypothetical protein B0F90DRAFT_960156 [Multifurca ochricompacta]
MRVSKRVWAPITVLCLHQRVISWRLLDTETDPSTESREAFGSVVLAMPSESCRRALLDSPGSYWTGEGGGKPDPLLAEGACFGTILAALLLPPQV